MLWSAGQGNVTPSQQPILAWHGSLTLFMHAAGRASDQIRHIWYAKP